jgi:hypothetical protein
MKSHAFDILRTFTENEIKEFESFILSPFHNKNSKVISLFETVKKFHPEYNQLELSKEKLHSILLPGRSFKESYIRNLLSDLNMLLENFLRHINFRKSHNYHISLIEEGLQRGLAKNTQKKLGLFESLNDSSRYKDSEYLSRKIFIQSTKTRIMHDKYLLEDFRKENLNLLASQFLLATMENSYQSIIEEHRLKVRRDTRLLKLILNFMKNRIDEFREYPVVLIFFYIGLCFFERDNEKYYQELVRVFRSNYERLDELDRRNIYVMMQTYCQKKISEGKTEYYDHVLKLLIEMLENNVEAYSESEYLGLNFCRNFIVVTSRARKKKALEEFIQKHLHKVEPHHRESIKGFAYANLFFIQKQFSKAIEFCNKTHFNELFISGKDNLYFKIDIKRILLICYYELGYFEMAVNQIDAYKHFLNNSKLIRDSFKDSIMKFLGFTDTLIRLKFSFDEYKLDKLYSQVKNSIKVGNRDWLMEKAEEMRRSIK